MVVIIDLTRLRGLQDKRLMARKDGVHEVSETSSVLSGVQARSRQAGQGWEEVGNPDLAGVGRCPATAARMGSSRPFPVGGGVVGG